MTVDYETNGANHRVQGVLIGLAFCLSHKAVTSRKDKSHMLAMIRNGTGKTMEICSSYRISPGQGNHPLINSSTKDKVIATTYTASISQAPLPLPTLENQWLSFLTLLLRVAIRSRSERIATEGRTDY